VKAALQCSMPGLAAAARHRPSSLQVHTATRPQGPARAPDASCLAVRPKALHRRAGCRQGLSHASETGTRASATAAAVSREAAATAEDCVVVVDNYDSFTYNLCQYLGNLGCKYIVLKNDEKTVEEIQAMKPAGILVSPGPGRPEDSGISLEIIEKLGPVGIPTFGVCMGHQCIGQVFGGSIIRAPCGVMHGKSSPVFHTNVGVLEGLPSPFQAARYHSLVIDKATCPDDIVVTAWTEDGTIMACHHKTYPHIQGVQFHPESVITDEGMTIVANFVKTLNLPSVD